MENLFARLDALSVAELIRTRKLGARELLDAWGEARSRFVKVFPHEYKRVLAARAAKAEASAATSKAQASAAAVAGK